MYWISLLILSVQSTVVFVNTAHTESNSRTRMQTIAAANPKNCVTERTQRLRLAQLTQSQEYIPECINNDKMDFAPVQCHSGKSICWCVKPDGRPITGSTIFNSRPDCSKYRRMRTIPISRRSSTMQRAKKHRKKCNFADRAKFNSALMEKFRSEFTRVRDGTSSYKALDPNDDVVVLTWKFQYLDKNEDGLLDRNETFNLKRLVKQQIQPRPCANSFVPVCAKHDKNITRLEWIDCFQLSKLKHEPFSGSSSQSTPWLSTSIRSMDPSVDISNCWTDRQSAIASQELDFNKSIIIPECTSDGKYERIQCAYGRAYCWCVNETTGLEIKDTVTINSLPVCDKRMKGCLEKRSEKFTDELLDFFRKQIQSSRQLSGSVIDDSTTSQEVVTAYFEKVDHNHNGFFDKSEWKAFKTEVSGIPRLRRCGKYFPRYCDSNKDSRVSLAEWTNCLQHKLDSSTSSRRTTQRSSGKFRSGKNPFTKLLQK